MMMSRGSLVLVAALAAGFAWPATAEPIAELPPEPAPLVDGTLAMGESVSVALDMAAVVHIPAGTETLAIGNPSIADVTDPRAGAFAVITGKSYGTTNMLAIGRDGEILQQTLVHVKAPREQTLTVLRGTARETWSCHPRCEPTVTLGDAPEYFSGGTDQVGNRNGLAGKR